MALEPPRDEGAEGAACGEAGSGDAVVQTMLKSFAGELDEERETRSTVLQDLHIRLGRELAEIRERDEARSKALELDIQGERGARINENAEIRAALDGLSKGQASGKTTPRGASQNDPSAFKHPGSASSGTAEQYDGEIVTLYGMVKEALDDTVRLSMEMNEERNTRQKEVGDIRRLIGVEST